MAWDVPPPKTHWALVNNVIWLVFWWLWLGMLTQWSNLWRVAKNVQIIDEYIRKSLCTGGDLFLVLYRMWFDFEVQGRLSIRSNRFDQLWEFRPITTIESVAALRTHWTELSKSCWGWDRARGEVGGARLSAGLSCGWTECSLLTGRDFLLTDWKVYTTDSKWPVCCWCNHTPSVWEKNLANSDKATLPGMSW